MYILACRSTSKQFQTMLPHGVYVHGCADKVMYMSALIYGYLAFKVSMCTCACIRLRMLTHVYVHVYTMSVDLDTYYYIYTYTHIYIYMYIARTL